MTRSILYATAAAVLFPLSAHAQSADDPESLPEVVVTATRLPAIAQNTPGARVIDGETIQRRGAVFASEILADIPGLSVTRSGASAGVAQVRMRGAAPGKTLVLIDGVPVNDASELNGAFDFSGADLGCASPLGAVEDPACDDGFDNDRDGSTDADGGGTGIADASCQGVASRGVEVAGNVGCGLGPELALLVPLLAALRRRRC